MTGYNQKLTANIDGYELVYYRLGKGTPMLMVHGITTYSFIWRKLVPYLKNDYELILVDLFGCGDSDKSMNISYSLKNHAVLLRTFAEQIKLKKFHLVGHDVGGGICQIMAVNQPDKILSLTLINTVAYDYWPVQPIIAIRTPIIRQLAMATLDLGAFKFIVKRGLANKERLTQELMELFWKPFKIKEGRKAFLFFAHCLSNKDLTEISEELKQLRMPTMIIRGDADLYLSKYITEKLVNEIPNCQYKIIKTGGHFIQEDEPEELSYTIISFLKMTYVS